MPRFAAVLQYMYKDSQRIEMKLSETEAEEEEAKLRLQRIANIKRLALEERILEGEVEIEKEEGNKEEQEHQKQDKLDGKPKKVPSDLKFAEKIEEIWKIKKKEYLKDKIGSSMYTSDVEENYVSVCTIDDVSVDDDDDQLFHFIRENVTQKPPVTNLFYTIKHEDFQRKFQPLDQTVSFKVCAVFWQKM